MTSKTDSPLPAQPPRPWFRRRWVLIIWIGLIAAMLALVMWGIIQLTSRGPDDDIAPQIGSSSSVVSSSPTTSPESTTTSTADTDSPASEQPSSDQPDEPHHHHHHHHLDHD